MQSPDNYWYATLTLCVPFSEESRESGQYCLSPTKTTVIGRSPECQVALNPHKYVTVSRRHAEIELVPSEPEAYWEIRDLGTINGTLVNEIQITNRHRLESGDRITLGLQGPEFIFECQTLNTTVAIEIPKTEQVASIAKSAVEQSSKTVSETKQSVLASSVQEIEKPKPAKSSSVNTQKTGVKSDRSAIISSESTSAKTQKNDQSSISQKATNGSDNKQANLTAQTPDLKQTAANATKTGKTIWNLIARKDLCQLPGHTGGVKTLAFSSDEQTLASAGADKTIKIWDLANQEEKITLTGHKLAVNALAFSSDGQTLASAGADKTIKIWDLANQEEKITLTGHKLVVNALIFSPDGQTLASASADKTVRLWLLATGEEILAIAIPAWQVGSIAIGSDGKTLAGSNEDGAIRLWQL
ncbi:FHA domain-containing protein [Pleurocapsales cyanobacterium LEGE 06147]|nr:FHA domain-containing protein [Pleurocapsales cyanobacterium LEGE 06147]